MEYISRLAEFIYNPLLWFLTAIIAFLLSSLLLMILQVIFAPMFGYLIREIEAMGFKYEKQNDGKWEYRGHLHKIGFSAVPVLDLKKNPGADIKKSKSNELTFLTITTIIHIIAAIGCLIGCLSSAGKTEPVFMASSVFLFGIDFMIIVLFRSGITVYAIIKNNAKDSLSAYYSSVLNLMRAGVPYEQLDLKSPFDPSFKNIIYAEKITYFPVYFSYLDACGKYDQMAAVVGDIENTLKPAVNSRYEQIIYCILVYYFSYHYIHVDKAKEYYHKAGDMLAKDKDPNGLRIKGFYELNCFGNVSKAKEYAAGAMASIDTFSSGFEREYERTCIAKLNEAISRFPGQ